MNPSNMLLFIIAFPAICATIGFFIGIKSEIKRNIFYILTTFINLCIVIYLFQFIKNDTLTLFIPHLLGTGLFLKLDVFRYIFLAITVLLWFIVTVYSSQYLIHYHNRNRYYLFFMITYACTIGVFLSDNLLNLFTFFEIMSFASYPMIIHDEDDHAHSASSTYVWMTTISGLLLLMGIFISYSFTQTLDISLTAISIKHIGNIKYLISFLMILGFGIKAGIVPLHIWLPKAHPAAPTPASAVLSGVIVKTGIFGIIVVYGFIMDFDFYISIFLILCGFINLIFGGFYAVFEINIKKILAYSSISQLGYLFLGIGCIGLLTGHEEIALYGTLFHVVNHAFFKVLMFMGVGIIYMITHTLDINDLRGFGRFKPVLKFTFFIGLCAITGVPGFNGFTGKTMIHHALLEAAHYSGLWWLYAFDFVFYVAGALTTAYVLKLYFALFVENNSKYYSNHRKHINFKALFPMIFCSIVIITLGIFPNLFLSQISGINKIFGIGSVDVAYSLDFFNVQNIFSAIVTIFAGILIYKYFILKKLRILAENGNKIFVNTTEDSFTIEHDIYIPLIKYVFKHLSIFLHGVDNTIFKLYELLLASTHIGKKLKNNETNMASFVEKLFLKIYGEK